MKRRLLSRLHPSYVRAGLRASGTASDLRRLRVGIARARAGYRPARSSQSGATGLRILAHLPTYVPYSFGGSESSMQATLAFLCRQGHEARVIVDDSPVSSYAVDGIDVVAQPSRREMRDLYRWAGIVLTQGRSALGSFMRAVSVDTPVVLFIRDIADWQRLPSPPHLVVFNAEWQMHAMHYPGVSIVVHSPIEADRYMTTAGDRVTLINLNERKGGRLFHDLVDRMPDVAFLAVAGVWGEQVLPRAAPHNLEIVQRQIDVREIYSRTRILLIPSKWESFGRVAVEAGISGIPVIASPNPGTIEAMGSSALYASLTDLDEWIQAIRSLDDPITYATRSAAVAHAAGRFTGSIELLSLEENLKKLANR